LFLYTNKQPKKEETILFLIPSKRIKYFGINQEDEKLEQLKLQTKTKLKRERKKNPYKTLPKLKKTQINGKTAHVHSWRT
jgi:hypothetical protein